MSANHLQTSPPACKISKVYEATRIGIPLYSPNREFNCWYKPSLSRQTKFSLSMAQLSPGFFHTFPRWLGVCNFYQVKTVQETLLYGNCNSNGEIVKLEKNHHNFLRSGHHRLVVQWSTISWKCVHRVHSVGPLGPSPFWQTQCLSNQVTFECWTNWWDILSHKG